MVVDEKVKVNMSAFLSKDKFFIRWPFIIIYKTLPINTYQGLRPRLNLSLRAKRKAFRPTKEAKIPKLNEIHMINSNISMDNYVNQSNRSDFTNKNIDSISSTSTYKDKVERMKIEVEIMNRSRKDQVVKHIQGEKKVIKILTPAQQHQGIG